VATPNIDALRVAMKNNKIDVLVINESRMDNSIAPKLITINGYNWVSKDRNRFGGGVGFYIRNTIKYCLRACLYGSRAGPLISETAR
jgi:exonuclease III